MHLACGKFPIMRLLGSSYEGVFKELRRRVWPTQNPGTVILVLARMELLRLAGPHFFPALHETQRLVICKTNGLPGSQACFLFGT
jgi:hypothetical protein